MPRRYNQLHASLSKIIIMVGKLISSFTFFLRNFSVAYLPLSFYFRKNSSSRCYYPSLTCCFKLQSLRQESAQGSRQCLKLPRALLYNTGFALSLKAVMETALSRAVLFGTTFFLPEVLMYFVQRWEALKGLGQRYSGFQSGTWHCQVFPWVCSIACLGGSDDVGSCCSAAVILWDH